MGQVVTLKPRFAGKTVVLLMQAIEAEKTAPPDEPLIVVVSTVQAKQELKRRLQCMVGMRHTRIEVLTSMELAARKKMEEERTRREKQNGLC